MQRRWNRLIHPIRPASNPFRRQETEGQGVTQYPMSSKEYPMSKGAARGAGDSGLVSVWRLFLILNTALAQQSVAYAPMFRKNPGIMDVV